MARKPAQTAKPANRNEEADRPEATGAAAITTATGATEAADAVSADAGAPVDDTKNEAVKKPEGTDTAGVTQAADTVSADTGAPVDAAKDTEGAANVDQSADAPESAPAAVAPGPNGGEDGSGLPTDQSLTPPDADLVVICHRKGGRRRAGLKWAEGETRVSSADLTEYQLSQLRGDPQFLVAYIEKE